MLGGVKAKDVLPLTGAWIDGAQMLAALHFPNRSNHSIFLYCVISDLFGVCLRRGLACGFRSLTYCGFVFRHTNSTTLHSYRWFWVRGIVAHQPRQRNATSTALRGNTTPQPCRSTSTSGTRSAVSISMRLICCGVSLGFASSMHAAIEATIGDANDVPSTNL